MSTDSPVFYTVETVKWSIMYSLFEFQSTSEVTNTEHPLDKFSLPAFYIAPGECSMTRHNKIS